MAYYLVQAFTILLQCGLFILACYYFCIALFSLFPKEIPPASGEKKRFAVVIPAHNEEACLPGLLQSLQAQTYPDTMFSVFVMVDHCTDSTYDVALSYHATPLLRKTKELGKGAALEDAFSQIEKISISFDAFVVLDADNLADTRFLEELNLCMEQGHQAVQGYIDSKNPNENWLSHAYSSWYWLSNRMIQMGYDRLGLGCKLGGTGFAISKELLKRIPWKTSTMAEDAEYTILLSLQDQNIVYAHKAVVYDEKPISIHSSVLQRIRWVQGITQVQRDLSGKLLKRGKWNAFFRFWSDFLFPLSIVVLTILDLFSSTNLLKITSVSFVALWTKPMAFLILNFYLMGILYISVKGLFLDKKWNYKILLNLFGHLLYLLSWIPAGILGIVKHHKKEWYHTKHHHGL